MEKPNYFAVIPASVRYDDNLKMGEKLMYGEITALTNKTGECWASNNYFAELYKVTPQAISKWIKNLEKNNYIIIAYDKKGKMIEKRIIKMVSTDIDRVSTTVEGGINSSLEGYQPEIKENNTSINNTRINNKEIYKEIIDYLNEIAGKKYRHTDSTIKLIKARLNEGFTVNDFKKVIDKKTKDWKSDPKMKDYIRPQTLFGTKFESYLNQEDKKMSGFMGYMEEFYGKENNS